MKREPLKIGIENKFKPIDIAALLIILFTLAAHDMSLLFASVQVIASMIIFYFKIFKNNASAEKYEYVVWTIVFAFWGLISILWAYNSNSVLTSVRSIIQVAIVGFAMILYIDSYQRVIKVLKYITLGATALVIRMLIQVPNSAWGSERVGGYIGYGNNGAANVLAYASVCTFFLYLMEKKKGKFNIYFALSFVFIAFAFLCGSKKAVAIAILGVGFQLILNSKKPIEFLYKMLIVAIALVGMWYLIINVPFFYNVLGFRIEKMLLALAGQTGGDMSTLDRMAFIVKAIEVFKEHPWFGVGLDNFRYYNDVFYNYYAHNNYVELAADLGIFGVIWYYSFPIKVLLKSIKKAFTINYSFIVTMICTILIMDIANVSYYIDSIQLYFAITFGIYLQFKRNEKEAKLKEVNV